MKRNREFCKNCGRKIYYCAIDAVMLHSINNSYWCEPLPKGVSCTEHPHAEPEEKHDEKRV